MPLFHFALHGLDRFGIFLPIMYRAINDAAGCTNFRHMSRRHLAVMLPIISRIWSGAGSQADRTARHVHRLALAGGQLEIDFTESSSYNPLKEIIMIPAWFWSA